MRWAIVGASTIAHDHMINALQGVDGGVIDWVVSGSEAHGRAYALAHGIPRPSVALDDMLAGPAVAAVYISSTNEKHCAQALACMTAGKHVLCEKPLAMTLADAVLMVQTARTAGVTLATNHHLRCSGSHRAMQHLIASGRVGQILSLRVHHAVHLPPHLQGWRIHDAQAGGGVIPDITVHDADCVRFLLGEDPVSVVAQACASGLGAGVEDSVMSVWTMPSGAMVMAHESFTHRYAGSGIEVHGTQGSIFARDVMTQRPIGAITLVTEAGQEVVPFSDHDLYAQAVRQFVDAVAGQGNPAADGLDGVKSLAVALAVRDAATTGIRQTVNYGGLQ